MRYIEVNWAAACIPYCQYAEKIRFRKTANRSLAHIALVLTIYRLSADRFI